MLEKNRVRTIVVDASTNVIRTNFKSGTHIPSDSYVVFVEVDEALLGPKGTPLAEAARVAVREALGRKRKIVLHRTNVPQASDEEEIIAIDATLENIELGKKWDYYDK